jgi:nucleoside-diphosphate-sugar epimerase
MPNEHSRTAKLARETVTLAHPRRHAIPATVVRPSAVYGPTDMNQRVTQTFIEKALLGQKLRVQGADEALDFTFVSDTAKGFVLAGTRPEGVGEIFNITSGRARTLLEFVEAIKVHVPNINYEIVPRDETRPKRGTLDTTKAEKLLGYRPDYDLERGVAEYIAFNRKYWLANALEGLADEQKTLPNPKVGDRTNL